MLADNYGIYIFEKFDECDKDGFVCIGAYQYSQKVYECGHMLCYTGVHPATKTQSTLLFTKMKEAGYEWDNEKKELKGVEQESAWNEKIKGLNELETYILSLVPNGPLDAIKVDAKNIRHIINKEQNSTWSEEDDARYCGVIETEQYVLDVVSGRREFSVGNEQIRKECIKELDWLKSLKERMKGE